MKIIVILCILALSFGAHVPHIKRRLQDTGAAPADDDSATGGSADAGSDKPEIEVFIAEPWGLSPYGASYGGWGGYPGYGYWGAPAVEYVMPAPVAYEVAAPAPVAQTPAPQANTYTPPTTNAVASST